MEKKALEGELFEKNHRKEDGVRVVSCCAMSNEVRFILSLLLAGTLFMLFSLLKPSRPPFKLLSSKFQPATHTATTVEYKWKDKNWKG